VSIVRTESEDLARLLKDLEQEADKKKHETNDVYWQGRADAFRIALIYLPSFLYMNEEETLALNYERACELRSIVAEEHRDKEVVHDLDAFIVSVERLRGTFKEVNPLTFFSKKGATDDT
jgi:hypothetical protein